jgi:hypothetical protein
MLPLLQVVAAFAVLGMRSAQLQAVSDMPNIVFVMVRTLYLVRVDLWHQEHRYGDRSIPSVPVVHLGISNLLGSL